MSDAEWEAFAAPLVSCKAYAVRLRGLILKPPTPQFDGSQYLCVVKCGGGDPPAGMFTECADDAAGVLAAASIADAQVVRALDVAPAAGSAWAVRARLVALQPRSQAGAPLKCTFWDESAHVCVNLWGAFADEFERGHVYMAAYEVRGVGSEQCLRRVSRSGAGRASWCLYDAHFDRESAMQEGTIALLADDCGVPVPCWGASFDSIRPTGAAAGAAPGAPATLPIASEEQEQIVNALLSRACVSVNAVAGSGKTTTILLLLSKLKARADAAAGGGGKTLIICYNARLKEGTRARVSALRLNGLAEVHSFHSLGVKYYHDECKDDGGLSGAARGDHPQKPEEPLPAYSYVFIDEAQDMCVPWVLCAACMCVAHRVPAAPPRRGLLVLSSAEGLPERMLCARMQDFAPDEFSAEGAAGSRSGARRSARVWRFR